MSIKKYIGIPYEYRGRDFNGVDCFGLVYLVFREEFNVYLPDFTYEETWYKQGRNYIEDNLGKVSWYIVDPPYKKFDGLIFYLASRKIANHIALYVGNNKILHVYEGEKVHIDRLDNYWLSRLYKVVRYKDNYA